MTAVIGASADVVGRVSNDLAAAFRIAAEKRLIGGRKQRFRRIFG